mgnify:CR=1 FL=1
MYTSINFKSKKALKEAVAAGQVVTAFHPGIGSEKDPQTGTIYLEGPHYPEAHKWYAQAEAVNGKVVKVK